MTDVEEAELRSRLTGGQSSDDQKSNPIPPPMTGLPAKHPLNLLYRFLVFVASIWTLHKMEVFHKIMVSPDVSHGWFKLGMAASVALQALKGYIEVFDGKRKNKKIEYNNYRTETHITIFLFLLASFAFHVALWPAYGPKTLFIMTLFGYGILLQLAMVFPTWVQNILVPALMTFFIQQYQ